MKKLLLILLVSNTIFVGCSKEACYSCDSKVDAWVKENKTKLNSMNRQELSELEVPYQKGALRMFTPKRKKLLWKDKLNSVQKLPFSKLEKEHLQFIEQFLNNHDFKNLIPRELEEELLDWAMVGKDKFNWSESFIVKSFFLIGDIDDSSVIRKGVEDEEDDGSGGVGGGQGDPTCNCRYHLGCGPSWYCTSATCDETDEGCGFFGTSSCTGVCD